MPHGLCGHLDTALSGRAGPHEVRPRGGLRRRGRHRIARDGYGKVPFAKVAVTRKTGRARGTFEGHQSLAKGISAPRDDRKFKAQATKDEDSELDYGREAYVCILRIV